MPIRYARARELPSRLLMTPSAQAEAVDAVVTAYQKWNEHRDPEALLCDLLVDLLHWADIKGVNFVAVYALATRHYTTERDDHESLVSEVRAERRDGE